VKISLLAVAMVLALGVGNSVAQDNAVLAKKGKSLWQNRGCAGCHAIGKRLAGPDLAGVTQRRERDWLVRWLKDTPGMLATDSVAQAMLEEYKGMRMPGQKLSDQDVDAILAFIESETARIMQ
jgi:cytochrome c551/c552